MNNFSKNAMGGLLGAVYLMCFAFPFGLLFDVFRDKMPIGQFLINQVFVFFAVWFVGYFFVKEYRAWIAERNKPRSEDDRNDRNANNGNTVDGSKPDNNGKSADNSKPDAGSKPDDSSKPDDTPKK